MPMLEESEGEMITSGVSKDHVPFGRFTFDLHPASDNNETGSKSLSEGVGNISIYDSQITELWSHRVVSATGNTEELYSREKTVILSSTSGCAQGSSKILKSYTVQSKIKQVFWCSFLLPSNELDAETNTTPNDEIQDGFCIVESNCVTIVTGSGSEHHVTLPFHIDGAWPLEKGVLFQRTLENRNESFGFNTTSAMLPVWFSMLHPLADLSPVICRSGSDLSYVSTSTKHIVYISHDVSPYLAIIYDTNSKSHSMFLIRRTTPQEEKTYTELSVNHAADSSWQPKQLPAGGSHMTPSRTGFLTLSSVLSPAAVSMSPRIGTFGTPSLRGHSHANSPAHARLNPVLGLNSPSLTSMHHISVSQRSVAASPSLSASVAHSSFTSTGNHHQTQNQDINMPTDMLEPIRPDICLHHVWTDQSTCSSGKASRCFISTDLCGQNHICMLIPAAAHLRCIKLGTSNVATDSIILGCSENIPAKDACPAPSMNMILVLDLESNIRLYSGQVEISMLYIPRLSFSGHRASFSTTPVAPSRSTIRASSRPGSAKASSRQPTPGAPQIVFDSSQDEINWSPVQQELDDSAHFFLQRGDNSDRVVSSLHSVTKNRLVLSLLNGEMYSSELPPLSVNPAVSLCLRAFSSHLPHNIAMQALPRWYLVSNMAGYGDGKKDELDIFFKYLLDICGFPDTSVVVGSQPNSPCVTKKRAKTVPQPNDADFDNLLSNHRCQLYRSKEDLLGLSVPRATPDVPVLSKPKLSLDDDETDSQPSSSTTTGTQKPPNSYTLDVALPLAGHVYIVYYIFYLCYEEMKLNTAHYNVLNRVAEMLLKLSAALKLPEYKMIFLRDFPELGSVDITHWSCITIPSKIQQPAWFPTSVQSVPVMLASVLRSGTVTQPVFYLPRTTNRLEMLTKICAIYQQKCVLYSNLNTEFLQPLPVVGRRSGAADHTEELMDCGYPEELMLLYMCKCEVDQFVLDSLPFAYSLLLYEVIYKCQSKATVRWPTPALNLISRVDMAALRDPSLIPKCSSSNSTTAHMQDDSTQLLIHQATSTSKLKQLNGMEVLDGQVLRMRWSNDLRLEEVKRCLNSSQPAKITLQQKPETSDHHFIELKQRHLMAVCQRTMSLPVGRGMLTLKTHKPVLTESLHIPVLCLSGKSYPTQSSVELSNDSPSQSATRLSVWPAFHNGVAAGLCLDDTAQVDTPWILYNKPKVTDKDEMNLISEHAGFLMALGLNGHLNNLARLSLHDYLIKGHEMTAVGILLGISASMRGTMDISTVRLLTIHTPSLLPTSSTQLDIAHNTKIAALIGLGLVYQSSAHRLIAGVLLHEIDHPPETGSKSSTDDRESYSLAAGLALGMVMMGKGGDMSGLHDLNIANHLCLLMAGGHRSMEMSKGVGGSTARPSNGQVYEGETINTDVTSIGATLALGLTYFNTKSQVVHDWLKLPQTQYILETVRPDFLQMRVIAQSLIMWDNILPTEEWLLNYLPHVVAKNAFTKADQESLDNRVDYETHSQAYCYILSGGCLSMGLKFAGSCNRSAYDTLLMYTKKFLGISQKPSLVDQSGRHILENALCTCLLSLAMVMCGSGDLEVFRICRYLRTRIGVPVASYGSHMVVHMALALLFLGSGRYTLSSKPETLPLLICAFFPKFPVHSNDNRYHLQALRHLYVQAAEPRLLFPVDVDTGEPCYGPLQITLKPTPDYDRFTYRMCAPGVMPQVYGIEKIEICDQRYWPMEFTSEDNFNCIRRLLNHRSGLAVKRRYGHLPYSEDPGGVLGAMTRAMLLTTNTTSLADSENKFAEKQHRFLFMNRDQIDGKSFLYLAIRDAISRERPDLLPVYQKIHKASFSSQNSGLHLQQMFFLSVYKKFSNSCVISKDLVDLASKTLRNHFCHLLTQLNNKDELRELTGYCVNGELPSSMLILKHLALHPDILHRCILTIKDLSKTVLVSKLHLNPDISENLLSSKLWN